MKKKYTKGLTIISAFMTAILILSMLLLCSCGIELPLKGNLFDKKVLEKYEIGWLERPKNVTNEEQYVDSDLYKYTCEINDYEEFEKYVEKIFTNFKERSYTIAYLVDVDRYDVVTSYFKVAESDELPDFCRDFGISINYTFYYSTKSREEMKENNYGYKEIGSRYLGVTFTKDKNENGKYKMKIVLYGREEKQINILVDN